MIAYMDQDKVSYSDQAQKYLHTLRLSLVKTVNSYSKVVKVVYDLKRRCIHERIRWIHRLFKLTRYNFDHIFTFTWTIKFTEVNPLPASK